MSGKTKFEVEVNTDISLREMAEISPLILEEDIRKILFRRLALDLATCIRQAWTLGGVSIWKKEPWIKV